MQVIQTGVFGVNTIIVPFGNNKCFVVDPASCSLSNDEYIITDYLKSAGLDCVAVVLTHSHFDHIMGIDAIKKSFPNIQIAIHQKEYTELQNPPGEIGKAVVSFFGGLSFLNQLEKQPNATIALKDNQNLSVIDSLLKDWIVIHTPGHTPGSICLYNKKENVLISGDTLFAYGGYGRTDLPFSDDYLMQKSLKKLQTLVQKGTLVYPGHDMYGFAF